MNRRELFAAPLVLLSPRPAAAQAEDTRIANEVRRRYVDRMKYALTVDGEAGRRVLQGGMLQEYREILGVGITGESDR